MTQPMVDMFVKNGATESEARLIVDLAKKAAENAVESVNMVARTAPGDLGGIIRLAALRYLEVNISEVMKELGGERR